MMTLASTKPLADALVTLAEVGADAAPYRAAREAHARLERDEEAARAALHEGLHLLAEGQLTRDATTLRASTVRFAEARRTPGAEHGVVLLSLLAEADAWDALGQRSRAAARRLLARRLSAAP